jgi:hypothetical protein
MGTKASWYIADLLIRHKGKNGALEHAANRILHLRTTGDAGMEAVWLAIEVQLQLIAKSAGPLGETLH